MNTPQAPQFNSADFLRQHIQSILNFYEPRVIAPDGSFSDAHKYIWVHAEAFAAATGRPENRIMWMITTVCGTTAGTINMTGLMRSC